MNAKLFIGSLLICVVLFALMQGGGAWRRRRAGDSKLRSRQKVFVEDANLCGDFEDAEYQYS